MQTKHIFFAIAVSALVSALSAAALIQGSDDQQQLQDEQTKLIVRIAKLEKNLKQEKQARELLQDIISQRSGTELRRTQALVNVEGDVDTKKTSEQTSNKTPLQAENLDRRSSVAQRNAQRIAQAQPDYQIKKLVNSGFSTEEAEWVLKSESEVALRKLNQDYERRKQAVANDKQITKSAREQLRAELGDENYERYLTANGYSTSARVDEVMLGSPGANAGLRPGDRITAYDGRRVFNLQDVNRQTLSGNAGQSVLIEIQRNGEPLQLTIPRGPIGVSSRRR